MFVFYISDPHPSPRFDLVRERSINEVPTQVSSPTINVTFSDGYMDTIVLWKHYSNKEQKRSIDNDCNYLGHLLLEKDACVAMTGCIGMEDVVFTIMSKHATDSVNFVWTKEGKIHTVELDPFVSNLLNIFVFIIMVFIYSIIKIKYFLVISFRWNFTKMMIYNVKCPK